jgi:hypothetical protein
MIKHTALFSFLSELTFMCHNVIPFFCSVQNVLAARHKDRNRVPRLLKTGADVYLVVMFVDNGWNKIYQNCKSN